MTIVRRKILCVFEIQLIADESLASNFEDTYDTDQQIMHVIGEDANKIASKIVQNANQPIRMTKRVLANEVGHG